MIYKILCIALQQINKTLRHKSKDTVIQWNEHNIPEFSTTPADFRSGMATINLSFNLCSLFYIHTVCIHKNAGVYVYHV